MSTDSTVVKSSQTSSEDTEFRSTGRGMSDMVSHRPPKRQSCRSTGRIVLAVSALMLGACVLSVLRRDGETEVTLSAGFRPRDQNLTGVDAGRAIVTWPLRQWKSGRNGGTFASPEGRLLNVDGSHPMKMGGHQTDKATATGTWSTPRGRH